MSPADVLALLHLLGAMRCWLPWRRRPPPLHRTRER